MDEMFLGNSQQATDFYRSKGSKPPGLTVKKKEDLQTRNGPRPEDKLNPETLEPMSDEELYKLKRVRLHHDSDTVYMQSDVEFYDYFYREGEKADPLTVAAHQLKRVYMNAEDYFYALEVRDAYIDMVIEEQFGGSEYRFNCAMNEGEVYVPPTPFYSKRAKDYDLVSKGIYMIEPDYPDIDSDKVMEWFNEWWELHPEMKPDDLTFFEDVLTNMSIIKELTLDQEGLRSSTGRMVMSVSDIRKIEETLNSIYTNRTKHVTEDERLFSKTPTRIREEYKKSFHLPVSETLRKYMNGEMDEDIVDLNEMVYDKKTNRPMTLGEYRKRVLVRELSDLGWEKLPVMKALNVGTALERRHMTESRANIRKLKRGMAKQLEAEKQFQAVTYDHGGIREQDFDPMEELARYFSKG